MSAVAGASFTDELTGWGTFALAAIAAVSVVAQVIITVTDRRRADARARADRQEAEQRFADEVARSDKAVREERAFAQKQSVRGAHVQSLKSAVEAYQAMQANQGVGNLAALDRARAIAHLLALPDEIAVCMRRSLGLQLSPGGDRKLADICSAKGSSMDNAAPGAWVFEEAAEDFDRLEDLEELGAGSPG